MEHTHFVSVAALVYNDNGEILMVKSPWRGWEYPGGLVEPGETLPAALKREIWEESGVEAEITGFVGICKNVEKDIVNIDFCCRYLSGELKTSEESTEVRWMKPEEAMAAVTFPLTKKRLGQMLNSDGNMHCFGFTREPFSVIDDVRYPVGTETAHRFF